MSVYLYNQPAQTSTRGGTVAIQKFDRKTGFFGIHWQAGSGEAILKTTEFLSIHWTEPGEPLIEPPLFSPVIADPSFLFPEETPERDWELFAHSAWGIHRYSSPDGLAWRDVGIVARNAMRPFVRRIDGLAEKTGAGAALPEDMPFYLYFEAYRPFALPMTALPGRRKWHSTIALSRSANLIHWSRPETLLRPELPWMIDPALGDSISNPCLVRKPERVGAAGAASAAWRLYYSASLSWIPDCGFCEPRYLGAAESPSPRGPFEARPAPIVDPKDDPMPGVLGAGSMKVIAFDDGWIGLQNKIYRDPSGASSQGSRSAIFILRSEDGIAWRPARSEPLLAPSTGWTRSHVYACDCRFREKDGLWYLYFNARDGWRIKDGVERIGRIVGMPRTSPSPGS